MFGIFSLVKILQLGLFFDFGFFFAGFGCGGGQQFVGQKQLGFENGLVGNEIFFPVHGKNDVVVFVHPDNAAFETFAFFDFDVGFYLGLKSGESDKVFKRGQRRSSPGELTSRV